MKEKIIFILILLAQASSLHGEEEIAFSDPAIDRKWGGEMEGSSRDTGGESASCGTCGG